MDPVPGRTTGGPGLAYLGAKVDDPLDDGSNAPPPVASGSESPRDDIRHLHPRVVPWRAVPVPQLRSMLHQRLADGHAVTDRLLLVHAIENELTDVIVYKIANNRTEAGLTCRHHRPWSPVDPADCGT